MAQVQERKNNFTVVQDRFMTMEYKRFLDYLEGDTVVTGWGWEASNGTAGCG